MVLSHWESGVCYVGTGSVLMVSALRSMTRLSPHAGLPGASGTGHASMGNEKTLPGGQTLTMSLSLVNRRSALILLGLVGLQLLFLFFLLGLLLVRKSPDESDVLTRVLLGLDGFDYLLLAALLGVCALLWQQSRSRLFIDAEGIRARMPKWLGFGKFRQTAGSWHFRWDQVRDVRLEEPMHRLPFGQGLRAYRLVVDANGRKTVIDPYCWIDKDGVDHRADFRQMFTTAGSHRQLIEATPLMQAFLARGIDVARSDASTAVGPRGFDVTTHRGLALQVLALFLLGLYFVVDLLFLASYQALESVPRGHFVLVGLAAASLCFFSGRGAPPLERFVVGAMTTAVAVAATYPALLQYNARDAVRVDADYRAVRVAEFTAVDGALPDIDLRDHRAEEYWAEHPPGSRHRFTVLRGEGGFYQLHLTPLNRQVRNWYEARDRDP